MVGAAINIDAGYRTDFGACESVCRNATASRLAMFLGPGRKLKKDVYSE
jgi:hypothetical protein